MKATDRERRAPRHPRQSHDQPARRQGPVAGAGELAVS
jgi:hypothetical protein